ncbi:4-(cytidine 5'-diphospho)-2-C-methyl-D-erythritol kinase [uncultured Propionibacterium sp.]|uniref:4-(cytidine 5'-diphospho)-2-C-methyl-D-erythritol kinase n=1 Tax=uncultured Propionibacterium sp. TaxID=218066 RepID=UPI00292CBE57|nr:4-(cytidine 5'-diphospho)-2-C-methyl-D-erythritol kinase [uncultured Propionibacterium sp.]
MSGEFLEGPAAGPPPGSCADPVREVPAGAPGGRWVRVSAPAKINLVLRVATRGGDGFHRLSTVFHAVSLRDRLSLTDQPGRISVTTRGGYARHVADDETNLAVRAVAAVRDRFGSPGMGARIAIDKSIPVAGGMAGGSADCAAALVGAARLWDLDVGDGELFELAAALGSDVSFSLLGGTALGTGRGERLEPLVCGGPLHWVLAAARRGLPTPTVYGRFDERVAAGTSVPMSAERVHPADLIDALARGDAAAAAALLVNDLQQAALDLYPELAGTLAAGRGAGALAGIVSGSGPTCAFLCADGSSAADVAAVLRGSPEVTAVLTATGAAPGALGPAEDTDFR